MKNNIKLGLLAVVLCVVTIFSASCAPQAEPTPTPDTSLGDETVYPENGAKKIVSQARKLYVSADDVKDVTLAHYEGTPEIPLIDVETAGKLLDQLSKITKFELEETDTTLTITRVNGATCVIDFVEDSIYFEDFDRFIKYGDNVTDILESTYLNSKGESIYFKITDYMSVAGCPVDIDLAEKNIPLDIYEGKKYIPLQTFNDLLVSPFSYNYMFNSKDVFFISAEGINEALKAEYYSVEPAERSEALIEYTVNELCLLLDLSYGLQEEHSIVDGFEKYLKKTGLMDDFRSTDPIVFSKALASLTYRYFGDSHSGILELSPYMDSSKLSWDDLKYHSSYNHFWEYSSKITSVRDEVMTEGVKGYEEVDNTAYITFDSFTRSEIRFEDYSEESFNDQSDTLGLIIYAHSMITRENSPIENVVVDLSCNTGGIGDAAVYVVAWMLGYCDAHIANPITKSYSTCSYAVDVNLDGVFDDKDSIADKNLYCLISPASFSCGNLVASMLKESNRVTLIGETSGGGACAVHFASTPDGTLIAFSSAIRLSTSANGSYYGIDRGVDPHHHLSKLESYFERESLTEYINSLK